MPAGLETLLITILQTIDKKTYGLEVSLLPWGEAAAVLPLRRSPCAPAKALSSGLQVLRARSAPASSRLVPRMPGGLCPSGRYLHQTWPVVHSPHTPAEMHACIHSSTQSSFIHPSIQSSFIQPSFIHLPSLHSAFIHSSTQTSFIHHSFSHSFIQHGIGSLITSCWETHTDTYVRVLAPQDLPV